VVANVDLVTTQGVGVVTCALAGIAVGGGFDLYRACSGERKRMRWLDHAWDVLFVLGSLPVVVAALLLSDGGTVRLFALVAIASGMGLYFWMASPVILPAAVWGFHALRAGILLAIRIVCWPLAQMAAGLGWTVRPAAVGCRWVGRKAWGAVANLRRRS